MPIAVFKYLFLFQRYSSFLKYANYPSDNVICDQILIKMMEKDISANLYQKRLILCSKILLTVHHNRSLTVLLPWQQTGFQTSPMLKAYLATFSVPFSYLQMVARMHDHDNIGSSV